MKIYTEKEFSDLMYDTLKDLNYNITLQYPTTESEFPCIEMHNPLRGVLKTHNAFPIKTRFQFQATCWESKQRSCMNIGNQVEEKVRRYNLVRTNTSPMMFDFKTKKHGLTITFEVNYNAITNAFESIL